MVVDPVPILVQGGGQDRRLQWCLKDLHTKSTCDQCVRTEGKSIGHYGQSTSVGTTSSPFRAFKSDVRLNSHTVKLKYPHCPYPGAPAHIPLECFSNDDI